MIEISVSSFLGLIAAPVLQAELLPWLKSEQAARRFARVGALVTLGLVLNLVRVFFAAPASATVYAHLPLGIGHDELHFVVDSLSAPPLVLLSLLSLAVLLGGPTAELGRPDLRVLLWLQALCLLSLVTADLAVLALAWTLLIVPVYRLTLFHPRDPSHTVLDRVFKLYHGLGLAFFLSACLALGYFTRPTGFLHMSLMHVDANRVPEAARPIVFGLLVVAAFVRMGITPFHSWLPVTFERGNLLAVALLVSLRTDVYMLARLAIPAFPHNAHAALPMLAAIALFSAMYGALAALGQHNLRRLIGFWSVSQSGIMLTGLVFGDTHAVSGTLLYWLGFGVATIGLTLMVSALEARTGTVDMRVFGGIVRHVPNLSACFFLFGLATIAIPGTVAFVAEDMLVHGALEAHPLLTLVMIVAMVINAVTFVRAFTTTFLGERRPELPALGTLPDLLVRERVTAVALLIALVVAGVYPGPIVAMQAPAANLIAFMEQL